MRDAQGEEFKHFAMDLEFLLRRTPAWREVAQGILFKTGDIVERGEAAAVFHGWNDAITGISQASPHKQVSLGKKADAYPSRVAGAVERLLCEGITGPYGLALGREQYRLVVETAEHGDFVFESGQDLAIGYDSHDREGARLYLEESFSFHVATPEAAVALTP